MILPSPQEAYRRLRMCSEIRDVVLALRHGAQAAYEQGKFPHKPYYDIRSDVEYWKKLQREKQEREAQPFSEP